MLGRPVGPARRSPTRLRPSQPVGPEGGAPGPGGGGGGGPPADPGGGGRGPQLRDPARPAALGSAEPARGPRPGRAATREVSWLITVMVVDGLRSSTGPPSGGAGNHPGRIRPWRRSGAPVNIEIALSTGRCAGRGAEPLGPRGARPPAGGGGGGEGEGGGERKEGGGGGEEGMEGNRGGGGRGEGGG